MSWPRSRRAACYDKENPLVESEILRPILDRCVGECLGGRPGAQLIVWSEDEGVTDPKTGIVTVPKVKKATLKVKTVTSGLTCVAGASAGTIALLRVGDKVETYN